MTTYFPQCLSCTHLHAKLATVDGVVYTCDAFPRGIPSEIIRNRFDHRQPHTDDNGLRWSPKSGIKWHPMDAVPAGSD